MGDVLGTSSTSWKRETLTNYFQALQRNWHKPTSNLHKRHLIWLFLNLQDSPNQGVSCYPWVLSEWMGSQDGCLTGNSFPLLGGSPEFLIFWQMFEQAFQFSSTYNTYYSNRALWKHCLLRKWGKGMITVLWTFMWDHLNWANKWRIRQYLFRNCSTI